MRRVEATARMLLAFSTLALVSCAKPAFTDGVRQQYALSPADIGKIQFYTSSEIVLQREAGVQEKSSSSKAGLTIVDGTLLEEVVIPSHTPCVALRVEDDARYILVGFSPAHPERSLWFGLKQPAADAPPGTRRYELLSLENPPKESGAFEPRFAKTFLVTYNGRKYRLADARQWNVHLLYDLNEARDEEKVREEPPGWKLTERPAPGISTPAPLPTPPQPSNSAPTDAPTPR